MCRQQKSILFLVEISKKKPARSLIKVYWSTGMDRIRFDGFTFFAIQIPTKTVVVYLSRKTQIFA